LVMHGGEVDAKTEALLYAADRAHHVARVIAPALAAGKGVICDRFSDSSVAYQGAGRALGMKAIRGLSDWASGGVAPDLTF
ncbi:dTMP kinase, partial [Pauljensenia sp. UMB0018B]|nr:dTMP kinase [Pauljensenia sp. UMB0018B]